MARQDDRNDRRAPGALARATEAAQNELRARTEQDADQTAADLDQTHAESDQVAAEADQQVSDTDQTLADRDQDAADRDQVAADVERSFGSEDMPTRRAHDAARYTRDATRSEREATTADRSNTSADRLAIANRRDEVARVRDLTAAARDRTARARDDAAAARDAAAATRERRAAEAGATDETIGLLRTLRLSGASARQQAATERDEAAADRQAAATDRQYAAIHRHLDGLDELTGVWRRGTGELTLAHEIDRSRRTGRSLVLAMIDVDALKLVNDTRGHADGDALLREVAAAILATLRSYDVTVRWGGDEFVAAMSDVTLEVAVDRVAEIQSALTDHRPGASISAGCAELCDEDTLASLVARADADLYLGKGDRGR
jgi:diguanylate cyclase (GGDEF)-like protein